MKNTLPLVLIIILGSGTLSLTDSSAETYPSAKPIKKGIFSGNRWKSYGSSRLKKTRIRRTASTRSVPRARTLVPAPLSKPKPAPPQPTTSPYVVSQRVLNRSNRSNTRVVIDISRQRAYLLVNGEIAVRSPISSARPGKYTPRGTFSISERVRSGKVSNIYHVGMPYWMRLGSSAYGVHAGHLPGYPASAGCVRLPSSAARLIYDNTRSGSKVSIYSSWSG